MGATILHYISRNRRQRESLGAIEWIYKVVLYRGVWLPIPVLPIGLALGDKVNWNLAVYSSADGI